MCLQANGLKVCARPNQPASTRHEASRFPVSCDEFVEVGCPFSVPLVLCCDWKLICGYPLSRSLPLIIALYA